MKNENVVVVFILTLFTIVSFGQAITQDSSNSFIICEEDGELVEEEVVEEDAIKEEEIPKNINTVTENKQSVPIPAIKDIELYKQKAADLDFVSKRVLFGGAIFTSVGAAVFSLGYYYGATGKSFGGPPFIIMASGFGVGSTGLLTVVVGLLMKLKVLERKDKIRLMMEDNNIALELDF